MIWSWMREEDEVPDAAAEALVWVAPHEVDAVPAEVVEAEVVEVLAAPDEVDAAQTSAG